MVSTANYDVIAVEMPEKRDKLVFQKHAKLVLISNLVEVIGNIRNNE